MNRLLLTPILLAALASAQTTTTATILLPNACVTQSQPTVTVLGENSLTTFSYGCTANPFNKSSAIARASSALNEAQSKAASLLSSIQNDLPTNLPNILTNLPSLPTNIPGFPVGLVKNKRTINPKCLGIASFVGDYCIPWEVTQGASYWAVHYTVPDILTMAQECAFGDGGVFGSGAATCTVSGNLVTDIWGPGSETQTVTVEQTDTDKWFIRNTVAVTVGGAAATTGVFAPKSTGTTPGTQSTGIAVPRTMPTGVAALVAGAGGILAAALAL